MVNAQSVLARVLLKHADFDNHGELAEECADDLLRDLKKHGFVLVMGWQPMESVPRDGSRFWGREYGNAVIMQWHKGFQAFVSSWRRMECAPGYLIDGQPFQDHSPVQHMPTAWMPIIQEAPET